MAHRREVLLSLVYVLALKYVVNVVWQLQAVNLQNLNLSMMMMMFIILEADARPRRRSLWRYGRMEGFVQRHFESGKPTSFSSHMIKERVRLNYETFKYMCKVLQPMLEKLGTRMEFGIDVETQVAITLSRLSTGNTLRMCGEMYGLVESTSFVIVRKCCEAIRVLLKPLVFQKLTKQRIEAMASEFEELKGIPYIIGAVDGSHIPIIAPKVDSGSYYCHKGFYSALLQGIVDCKCLFWDYDSS